MNRREVAIVMGAAGLGTLLGSLANPTSIASFKLKLQTFVGSELIFESEDVAKKKLETFLVAQGFYDYFSNITPKLDGNTLIDVGVKFTKKSDGFVYYPVIITSAGNI